MKEPSLKILFRLYSRDSLSEVFTNYEQISLLLPQLSKSGIRSAVSLLKQNGLITTDRVGSQTIIYITNTGTKAVEDQIPAFLFDGDIPTSWSCLVFLAAPERDPQFRYLRSLLLNNHAISLARGVYLYPGLFPVKVEQECRDFYTLSVVIMTVDSWIQGDLRNIVSQQQPLADLAQSYSGISKEITRLLEDKNLNPDLIDQRKEHISSVFNRLFQIAINDSGLTKLFFPQVDSIFQLLFKLQQLLSTV